MCAAFIFFITLLVFLSNGKRLFKQGSCNYAFVGLDENVTLSSSTNVYEVAASIGLHDIIRDTEADEKYFYINETSQYFVLEGYDLMVIDCLPAGLTEVLTFIIIGEEACKPGHLTIHVEPTIPAFNNIAETFTVDVDICTDGNTTEIIRLSFENQGDCFSVDCLVGCDECYDKLFWFTEGNMIATASKGIRFGFKYELHITCFDSSLTSIPQHNQASVGLTVWFKKTLTCSLPLVLSTINSPGLSTTSITKETTTYTPLQALAKSHMSTVYTSAKKMNDQTTTKLPYAIAILSGLTTKAVTRHDTTKFATGLKIESSVPPKPSSPGYPVASMTPEAVSITSITVSSNPSIVTTSSSPTNIYNAQSGFFDEKLNIATVSVVGGVLFLCILVSFIIAVWSKWCLTSSMMCGRDGDKEERA